MEEIWKDIKDYEHMYQCSNLGNVRTLDRYVYEKSGKRQFRKGIILKATKNKNGYLQVALNKNAVRKMKYIHKLVAEIFIENPYNFNIVNHKDGNKYNNTILNLEWCTYSDNNTHAYKVLNRKCSNYGGSKVKVYVIDTLLNKMDMFESITCASKSIYLSPTQINRYLDKHTKWKGRFLFVSDRNKRVEDIEKVS